MEIKQRPTAKKFIIFISEEDMENMEKLKTDVIALIEEHVK